MLTPDLQIGEVHHAHAVETHMQGT